MRARIVCVYFCKLGAMWIDELWILWWFERYSWRTDGQWSWDIVCVLCCVNWTVSDSVEEIQVVSCWSSLFWVFISTASNISLFSSSSNTLQYLCICSSFRLFCRCCDLNLFAQSSFIYSHSITPSTELILPALHSSTQATVHTSHRNNT
jgi:hypothetical protein